MELTKLTHTLTIGGIAHVIDEPIGFDGLKTKISRGNYHGVSAEVSASKLEFYNNGGRNAATLIRDAYNSDIDTEITYTVADESGETLYSGVLDLATYSETNGNATKVSVTVGEVGIKTIFNNRSDTEVDLNRTTTIDGAPLAHNPAWKNMLIPARTILYKNIMEQPETVMYDKNIAGEDLLFEDDASNHYALCLSLEKNRLNEFGTFEPKIYCGTLPFNGTILDGYVEPLFSKGSDFAEKYGADSTYNVEVHLRVRMKFSGDIVTPRTNNPYFSIALGLYKSNVWNGTIATGTRRYVSNDGGRYSIGSGSYDTRDTDDCHESLLYTFNDLITDCNEDKIYLIFWCYNYNVSNLHPYNNPTPFTLEIEQGSYVRMTLNSKKKTTVRADLLFVHEAINKIVECISENQLTCKSDLYARFDSIVNPNPSYNPSMMPPFGAGSLKAITNGYKIRNLYSDSENERNMPMSFKDIIEALDAIDCIGWGIIEENGTMYIRVENWEWFYNNDVVLTINDPNEKTRAASNESVFTKISNGYKKYTTNEDYNTNENYHSERTFTSKVKAMSKEASQLCKWIADTYSIEVTRRAKDDIDATEEFKYDENIFVLEIAGAARKSAQQVSYSVASDSIISASGITSISELYNARISPRRMAERWKQRLALFNSLSPLVLTKGTVNYKAKIKCKQDEDLGSYYRFYLANANVSELLAEDASIAHVAPLMKAETLKIKYPLTLNQYKAIKANPYGLIVVDGEKCWLKEMQYEFKTGTAEFTLIPKYEQ